MVTPIPTDTRNPVKMPGKLAGRRTRRENRGDDDNRLRQLADAEPDDEQRQKRELGDRPRGLDRRIEHRAHAAMHAHEQADGDTDDNADSEGDAEAHQTDEEMVK